MKFFKKDTILSKHDKNENIKIKNKFHHRIDTIRRNMSRGAANIFRMIRTRCKWGNKQLWGSREKGRNNPKN